MRLASWRSSSATGEALEEWPVIFDDVVDNLPFIVRRDHRIVAAFARKQAAIDWAEMRSSLYRRDRV